MRSFFEQLVNWVRQYPIIVYLFRWARGRWQRLVRATYLRLCLYCPDLVRAYFVLSLKPKMGTRESILDRYSRNRNDFVFIQVGANDGYNADPIHSFIKRDRWSGVLVEPQETAFRTLKQVYANHPNLILLNAAIDREVGSRTMYGIAVSDSRWASGLSSFNKETVLEHVRSGYVAERARMENKQLPNKLEDCIAETIVETVPFSSILQNYGLERVDLLQIDAEGFDAQILEMFPFEDILPTFVNFEYIHLDKDEFERVGKKLSELGYDWFLQGNDAFCVHNSIPVEGGNSLL